MTDQTNTQAPVVVNAEQAAANAATYAARGIGPETWTCVAIGMSQRDARDYLWRLAGAGLPALVSKDEDGKGWHVAVRGGLPANPLAWLLTIREDAAAIPTCHPTVSGQHVSAHEPTPEVVTD